MANIRIIRTVDALRSAVADWRRNGETVGLVPTMGALHAGHLSLVAEARRLAARAVATIFVNPKQFGPSEDLDRYPRQEAADVDMLEGAGCDLLFAPTPEEMYPRGFATNVSVSGLGDILDGAARPGHFDGVATVVAKLLNMAQADVAIFGEKDWQQLAIIRRMAADLDIVTAILGAPIVRDADGLALSSRNAYLSADERRRAVALPDALKAAVRDMQHGRPVADALAGARFLIAQAGFAQVDYVELRDAAAFGPMEKLDRRGRILAAARIGSTRLIDNMAADPR